MPKLNVLLLESIHPVAEAQLKDSGLSVRRLEKALGEDELIAALDGVHLLGIRSKTQLTARVLNAPSARELLAIGCFCIGTNQVDLAAAMRRGVVVFNSPFSNTRSVAELILAEIIMLSRELGDRNKEVHQGTWKKRASGSREIRGKTLGIVGYGHIGTQIGLLGEFLGMRVVYFDVSAKLPLGNAQPLATLETLLEQSDFVTLHVPENAQTKGMLNRGRLTAMKPGAYLLNASRGTVVDLEALAEAIRSRRIRGAAIDVYPSEPEKNDAGDFVSPLQNLPNTILTPHIGGSTEEAQESIGNEVARSLVRFWREGATAAAVNFPACELPLSSGISRLTHIHQNVPGVLRDVNRVVSEAGANVHAQLLATNADVGYLVVDLDSALNADVVRGLLKLSTTIAARAL